MQYPKPTTKKHRFFRLFLQYTKYLALVCLAAVLPLVMFWANNLGQVRSNVVVKPMGVILLAAWGLFSAFAILLRSLPKSTLLALMTILLFFSYGHIVDRIPADSSLRPIHILGIYGLLFLVGSYWIFRAQRVSQNLFLFFGVAAGFVFIFNLAQIIRFSPSAAHNVEAPQVTVINDSTAADSPDIYYIVLDSYARADVLQDVYGYDNSEFIKALRSRGFYIPDCAWSNYENTYDAMASVLNLDYLDKMGISDSSLGQLTEKQGILIQDDQARRIFNGLDYQFVTARGFGAFDDIQNSDIYLNYYLSQGQPDELGERSFISLFLKTTLLRFGAEAAQNEPKPAADGISTVDTNPSNGSSLAYDESLFWYHQTNYVFDSVAELPKKPGAYLVYAHINAPHGPYVFDPSGNFRFSPDSATEKSDYVDTLVYLNQRVLGLIDTLQQESETPPIILLQSDHGTHYYTSAIDMHKILSAYYLPGDISLQPYPTITPVNNFRLILHDYFDPSVQLLPDTLFIKEANGFQAEAAACGLDQ